jgi:hypothetical protein
LLFAPGHLKGDRSIAPSGGFFAELECGYDMM